MSTYEPGRLYLIDLDGETHEAIVRSLATNAEIVFLTREGRVVSTVEATNIRVPIVLDPEDEDVQTLMRGGLEVKELDTAALSLVHKIRAQITPPEPPMEEPQRVGALVQTPEGDIWARQINGYWTNLDDPGSSARVWTFLSKRDPRPYENPRQEPATAPQSDAQGLGSGIGRVSDSEAVDGRRDPCTWHSPNSEDGYSACILTADHDGPHRIEKGFHR